MSSAIVLEGAIVYVYAIDKDGLCEWKPIPRLLEAVNGEKNHKFEPKISKNFLSSAEWPPFVMTPRRVSFT